MPNITLHLDDAEFDAVERLAEHLACRPEDIAYCALNRLMIDGRDPAVHTDIRETRAWRKDNLPLWSDSGGSVHGYEGKPDCDPVKSKYSI